jgi:hypothetical protein
MYYLATLDVHKAIAENNVSLFEIATTTKLTPHHPLMPYFYADRQFYFVYEFMLAPSNFFVTKVAIWGSLLFFKSYTCICMTFAFIALGGSMRLFKLILNYYPTLVRELAFAVFFLPSVAYWSGGLMKDPICFAAMGFLVYGIYKSLILKKDILPSIFWVIVSGILLFVIKVYILLALIPAICFWLLTEYTKKVEEKIYRRMFAIVASIMAAVVGFFLLQYMTSFENVRAFQLETLLEKSSDSREIFANTKGGSQFQIETDNPILLMLNGIVATFFRPFLWEVNTPIALFSALEALLFSILLLSFLFKKGVVQFFSKAFSSPVLILCSIFALVFAASVGSSATNFGTLSRYKIPCLPFFLSMLLIIHHVSAANIPKWIKGIVYFPTKSQIPNK